MRLFVALTPPGEILDEVEEAVSPHRGRHPGLRWVHSENRHVTLSFLGEVADEQLPHLYGGLDRAAAAHGPLRLSFAGAGAFPRATRGRVLWVGLVGEGVSELAASVATAARGAGVELERRKFSAHLTLARARQPGDLSPLVDALAPYQGTTWRADAFHLIRSHLGRPGPRYETLASWPLSASGRDGG